MSRTIYPVPLSDRRRVHEIVEGDWIGESPSGPWYLVHEAGDTCLLVGDSRRADAQVVDITDPDGLIFVLDPSERPRR